MATILSTYDFKPPSEVTRTPRQSYPWEQWLDGNIWRLVQGEDFQPHPLMMERIIRTRATAKRAKVHLRHEALNGDFTGVIVVQRTDISKPRARKAAASKVAPAGAKKVNGTTDAKKAPAKKAVNRVAPKTKVARKPLATATKKAAPSKKAARK